MIKLTLSLLLFALPAYAGEPLCPKENTSVEILECMVGELEKTEQSLDEAFQREKNKAVKFDTFINEAMQRTGRNLEALEKSQEAFIEYRDAECLRERVFVDTGSMAGHTEIGCKITLNKQRIEELK